MPQWRLFAAKLALPHLEIQRVRDDSHHHNDDTLCGQNRSEMIARPVAAALRCCDCRYAILRAVLSKPAAKVPPLAQRAALRPISISSPRAFSSSRDLRSDAGKAADAITEARDEEERELGDEDSAGTPWFLEVDPPRHPPIQHAADLPKAPEDAPPLLEPMIKYIYEDMGLDEISMLDLRGMDPPAALGPNLIMLFATARSERHLHISAGRFVRWLRRNHKVGARADGLIGPGELKTKLRRLRKRAKLLGTNASIVPGGDNGISTGWVCVNFSANDSDIKEVASFDQGGRFSGFGAPITGTTVVVQCMTESRRNELDLETLWQGVLKRNLEEGLKIQGKKSPEAAEIQAMLASRLQLPDNPASRQWQALKLASEQQRQFSTMARRLQSHAHRSESKASSRHPEPVVTEDQSGTTQIELSTLKQNIRELQAAGTPFNQAALRGLIAAVFQAYPPNPDTASERLALVDQLCLAGEERGMYMLSTEWLVNLIEAILSSPVYGLELQRSQENLEFLLTELRSALTDNQVLRLMTAYAHRKDWDKFWNIFRTSPRYRMPRSLDQYELAYRAMAATGDRRLCTDALRWVYPEMLKEQPTIWPTGSLYDSLKACILVADPAAEQLLHNPPPTEQMDIFEKRRLMHREFVRVLKEVESLRLKHAEAQAREHRAQVLHGFSTQATSGDS